MKVQLQMSNNLICKYNDAAQHDHVAIPVQMKWYHNNEQYKNNYKQKCAAMFASDSVGATRKHFDRYKHEYVYDWQNKVVSDKTGNEQTEIEKYQV